ncbi:hypothetical protein AGMMS4957_13780 [Bacteroidia bacterium]|nr:hypothetical protein AGMMS4957_13780 [Bacteroidia bacterium]
MKKSLLICFFLLSAGVVDVFGSDYITFGYDAAGNRVSREICYNCSPPNTHSSPTDTVPFFEVLSGMVVKIYPNPTEGLLHVLIENMQEGVTAQMALYQLNGMLVTTQKGIQNSAELNISNQPTGIYVLRIVAGKEHTEWKIIKK